MPSLGDDRRDDLRGVLGEAGEVDGREPEGDPAALEPGDVEQVVDEPLHVQELAVEDRVDLGPGGRVAADEGGAVGHGRQGVAELVGEHRQVFVLAAVGLAEPGLGLLQRGHDRSG